MADHVLLCLGGFFVEIHLEIFTFVVKYLEQTIVTGLWTIFFSLVQQGKSIRMENQFCTPTLQFSRCHFRRLISFQIILAESRDFLLSYPQELTLKISFFFVAIECCFVVIQEEI